MVKRIEGILFPLGREGKRMASELFQEYVVNMDKSKTNLKSRNRRVKRRQLFCHKHPEKRIEGNGKKYFLHLLTSEELRTRGFSDKTAKLVINAYPVFVLSNEWLEELFCPECGTNSWCHVIRHDPIQHSVTFAPKELWMQVAHVDPIVPNPSVSEFTRRSSRRTNHKRSDGKRYWD